MEPDDAGGVGALALAPEPPTQGLDGPALGIQPPQCRVDARIVDRADARGGRGEQQRRGAVLHVLHPIAERPEHGGDGPVRPLVGAVDPHERPAAAQRVPRALEHFGPEPVDVDREHAHHTSADETVHGTPRHVARRLIRERADRAGVHLDPVVEVASARGPLEGGGPSRIRRHGQHVRPGGGGQVECMVAQVGAHRHDEVPRGEGRGHPCRTLRGVLR